MTLTDLAAGTDPHPDPCLPEIALSFRMKPPSLALTVNREGTSYQQDAAATETRPHRDGEGFRESLKIPEVEIVPRFSTRPQF